MDEKKALQLVYKNFKEEDYFTHVQKHGNTITAVFEAVNDGETMFAVVEDGKLTCDYWDLPMKLIKIKNKAPLKFNHTEDDLKGKEFTFNEPFTHSLYSSTCWCQSVEAAKVDWESYTWVNLETATEQTIENFFKYKWCQWT